MNGVAVDGGDSDELQLGRLREHDQRQNIIDVRANISI
jgi:hypothetical protein